MNLNGKKYMLERFKNEMRRLVEFNATHPEALELWRKSELFETRLRILLNSDKAYQTELAEAMKQIKEKYAQKYIDEGLL